MSKVTILTHFSATNWPVVNKLSGVAKCLGVDMIHCSTVEKLSETVKTFGGRRVLFFTDEGLIETVQKFESSADFHVEVAMFIRSPLPKVAEQITSMRIVKYLISLESMDSYGRDLSILVKKFADGDILDLEKYLAFGCNVNKRTVVDASSKRAAVNELYAYIENLGDPGYNHPYTEYARRVSEMADELLINAIFDANPRFRGVDRSLPFTLATNENIEIAWGYDGEFFGVSVRDPFGKFACETILKYVAAQRTKDHMLEATSGGLGLKLIFEKAHKVITNVQRESATEVIALVRFDARMLEFERRKKSFYYFGNELKKTP